MESAHSKSHFFRSKINQQVIIFLIPHSGTHFLRFWEDLVPKNGFGDLAGRPAESLKWRPKSPMSQRWWHFSQRCDRHFADSLARSPSERSWAPFWLIWDGFLKNVKGFVHNFPSPVFLFIDLSSILNGCWLHL